MKTILLTFSFFAAAFMSSCKKDQLQNLPEENKTVPEETVQLSNNSSTLKDGTIDLGEAANYAVLGLTGTLVNLSNVTINGGRVGVSNQGSLNLASPTTVNGNVYIHTGATYSLNGILNGTLFTGQDLSAARNAAIQASLDGASMQPNATYNSLTSAITFLGNGGWNVINVGSVNLGSGAHITLHGSGNDFFVVNISGSFKMSGNAQIRTSGGVPSSHVIINILGTGSTATSNVGNLINGTILSIDRSVTFHGIAGQVICGGQKLTLMSNATVNYIPYSSEFYGTK